MMMTLSNSGIASSSEPVDIRGGNINITAQDDGINAISRANDEYYLHISSGIIVATEDFTMAQNFDGT